MFVNRKAELELLNRLYHSDKAELFVLYGRRRVGKTELLTHFCTDKRTIFFVADLNAEPALRAGLSKAVNQELFGAQAAQAVYQTWEDLFLALAEAAQHERLLVVLDEFTYLVAAHPPLASLLQRLWDSTLCHSKLMLILCGSYIGMMEDAVLGYQAPLYGRRTAQYLLETLTFFDARQFYPHYSAEDQVRTFAVIGGTPGYLNPLTFSLPLDQVVQTQVLQRGAFLYDEARLLLQQELRQPRAYFAVLEAIAGGRTRLNEIKQATGLEGVTAYLETLQNLLLVQRVVPATETQPHKSRRGLYQLKDHFFRFWFRFLHPNRTLLERGAYQVAWQSLISAQIDAFVGPVFEEICEQFLWNLGMTGKLTFLPVHSGKWWRANEEIDVVLVGSEDVLVAECKWAARPVGTDILQDLQRKGNLIQRETGDKRLAYALCSRSGFTPQLQELGDQRTDLLLIALADMV
jgi:AAA+ ATPase superfamily predicted ATPase